MADEIEGMTEDISEKDESSDSRIARWSRPDCSTDGRFPKESLGEWKIVQDFVNIRLPWCHYFCSFPLV